MIEGTPSDRPAAARLRGIEGLRGIAALAVLAYHVAIFVRAPDGGFAPVGDLPFAGLLDLRGGLTLFFVLSGFLLHRPIARALVRGVALPPVRPYVRNRVLRIAPAYWVVLLLTAFVLQTAVERGAEGVGRLDDPVQLLACLLLVQPYSPETVYAGLGPDWSLSVEALFYVLLPVLGALAAVALGRSPAPGRRIVAAALPAAALLALGAGAKLAWHVAADQDLGRWTATASQTLPLSADLFGIGMLVALVHVLVAEGRLAVPRHARRVLLGAAATAALGTVLLGGRGGMAPLSFEESLLALGCAALLLAVVLPGPSRLAALLERRGPVWAGLCSYSVYLWHVPVIFLLSRWGLDAGGRAELAVALVLVLGTTAALAVPTYLLVERPALRRKGRAPVVAPADAPAAAMAVTPARP